ncbi:hypothetical protein [Sphingosinicella sp. BN140058]|uniref:hypothetical protein n=1 Tax=Sphingosinicella sp. BN140058 TaxID=1892855 RepID=UPI0010111316|nr:hypothetical protein [Sphingosinicella sp. BN140058]QAY75431.1 hypothetical protein ETR14_01980 [Sphingosinicella sp. BN140058]
MTSTDTSGDLARMLAFPERGPDEIFVQRVNRTIDIEIADRLAKQARREAIIVELLAAGALLVAARQLIANGTDVANLVLPLVSELGALTILAATLFLLVALVSEEGIERTR